MADVWKGLGLEGMMGKEVPMNAEKDFHLKESHVPLFYHISKFLCFYSLSPLLFNSFLSTTSPTMLSRKGSP